MRPKKPLVKKLDTTSNVKLNTTEVRSKLPDKGKGKLEQKGRGKMQGKAQGEAKVVSRGGGRNSPVPVDTSGAPPPSPPSAPTSSNSPCAHFPPASASNIASSKHRGGGVSDDDVDGGEHRCSRDLGQNVNLKREEEHDEHKRESKHELGQGGGCSDVGSQPGYSEDDHYSLLGVSPLATSAQIKTAYIQR